MLRTRMNVRSAPFLVLCLLGCELPVSEAELTSQQPPPLSERSAVMAGRSTVGTSRVEFAVRHDGSATVSIPLEMPHGPAGSGPSLQLRYLSGTQQGLAGAGWSLGGVSAITRCPRTSATDGVSGRVDFGAGDRFCLDGQRLIEVGSGVEQGRSYWEYRTEVESFSRVRAFASTTAPQLSLRHNPERWEVRTRSGQRLEFGGSAAARSELSAAERPILLWGLSRSIDPAGNVVTFSYQGSPQIYLASIAWGGNERNGAVAEPLVATLTYGPRPAGDARRASLGGFSLEDLFRLERVQTSVRGRPLREFRLAHQASRSGRSLLSSVQECGFEADAPVCLPPVTFSYAAATSSLGAPVQWGSGFGAQLQSGDFDGNGAMDLLGLEGTRAMVSLSTRSAFGAPASWAADLGDDVRSLFLVDWDLDGATDLLRLMPSGDLQFLRSTRTSFAPPQVVASGLGSDPTRVRLGDVTGDGRPDLLRLHQGAALLTVGGDTAWRRVPAAGLGAGRYRFLYVDPASGHWYRTPVATSFSWTTFLPVTGVYEYGRGYDPTPTDSFSCTSVEPGAWGVGCSTGPGPQRKVLPIAERDPNRSVGRVCQDQPGLWPAPCLSVDVFYLDLTTSSSASGSPLQARFATGLSNQAAEQTVLGNFDGDGRADLAHFDGAAVSIWISEGTTSTRREVLPVAGPFAALRFVDADADGKTDIVRLGDERDGTAHLYRSLGRGFASSTFGTDTRSGDLLADVSGDGRIDLLRPELSGALRLRTGTTTADGSASLAPTWVAWTNASPRNPIKRVDTVNLTPTRQKFVARFDLTSPHQLCQQGGYASAASDTASACGSFVTTGNCGPFIGACSGFCLPAVSYRQNGSGSRRRRRTSRAARASTRPGARAASSTGSTAWRRRRRRCSGTSTAMGEPISSSPRTGRARSGFRSRRARRPPTPSCRTATGSAMGAPSPTAPRVAPRPRPTRSSPCPRRSRS